MNVSEIITNAAMKRASDIHVSCGLPIKIRVDGELIDYDGHVMTHEDCDSFAEELAGGTDEALFECGERDFAGSPNGQRIRVNLYRQQGHISAAIRLLNDEIPKLSELGLPETVKSFADYRRGIVLVTGETGSGKTTTLAALLDTINHTRRNHIITLEDPVEYIYRPDKAVISQREIGKDTESYDSGMKAILREDPDVILVGEMRSLETIETALTAAETGHLVFSTLHTNSAADAVDRIVSVFPGEGQQQIRMQLSMTLKAVLSQQLLKRNSAPGRVPACEVMIVNSAIKNLIREGKTPQINNSIQTSSAEGGQLMDNAILKLLKDGQISIETALSACQDQDYLRGRLGGTAAKDDFAGQSLRGRQTVSGGAFMQESDIQRNPSQRGMFR